MKENAEKTRALDTAELNKQVRDAAEQMFRLRFQMSMGQNDGITKLRKLRKERARMLTVLRERELGERTASPVPAPKPVKAKAAVKEMAPKAAAKPAVKKAAVKKVAVKKEVAAKPAVKKTAAKKEK